MGQFMQSNGNPAGIPTGSIQEMGKMDEQVVFSCYIITPFIKTYFCRLQIIANQLNQANLSEALRIRLSQLRSGGEDPLIVRNPPDDGNSGDGTGGGNTQ